MKLTPYGARLIVRKRELKAGSGIILLDSAKNSSLVGDVIAIGAEVEWAGVGDVVLFGKHSGFTLPDDSNVSGYRDCILMNNDDLLSKLED